MCNTHLVHVAHWCDHRLSSSQLFKSDSGIALSPLASRDPTPTLRSPAYPEKSPATHGSAVLSQEGVRLCLSVRVRKGGHDPSERNRAIAQKSATAVFGEVSELSVFDLSSLFSAEASWSFWQMLLGPGPRWLLWICEREQGKRCPSLLGKWGKGSVCAAPWLNASLTVGSDNRTTNRFQKSFASPSVVSPRWPRPRRGGGL